MSDTTSSAKQNATFMINLWRNVLLEKELEIIRIIKSHYPDDIQDADIATIHEYITSNLVLEHNKPVITTEKKAKKIKELSLEERCLARCWDVNEPTGKQCSRAAMINKLCKQHSKNLPHGIITEPLTKQLQINYKKYGK